MAGRFTEVVARSLATAGWEPTRSPPDQLSDWQEELSEFPRLKASEQILAEFGGIRVEAFGPGIDCAKSGIEFDPRLGIGESESLRDDLGDLWPVYPLGETTAGHALVVVDQRGSIYAVAMHGGVSWLGDSIEATMDRLLTGREGREISV